MKYINAISGKEVKPDEIRDIVKACISRDEFIDIYDDNNHPVTLNGEKYGVASVANYVMPEIVDGWYDEYISDVTKGILEGHENEDVMINIVE